MDKIRNIFMSGSIDLNTICPKIAIKHLAPEVQQYATLGKNGHVYLSCAFAARREVSNFGQTHLLKCSKRGCRDVFLGDFKDFTKYEDNNGSSVNNEETKPTNHPNYEESKVSKSNVDDDLPF